jgi:hypothetical protein
MLSVQVLDKYLIEVKLEHNKSQRHHYFKCHFFIPNSLDINEYTYPKSLFHRHLHNEICLYSNAKELADNSLIEKINQHHTRKHATARHYRRSLSYLVNKIIKALEFDVQHAIEKEKIDRYEQNASNTPLSSSADTKDLPIISTLDHLDTLIGAIRDKKPKQAQYLKHFKYIDEYLNWSVQQIILLWINECKSLSKQKRGILRHWLDNSVQYSKENNYKLNSNSEITQKYTRRFYLLKDYFNRYRFLNIARNQNGKVTEQLVFSFAAFLSMALATVIAFATQQAFGNFTTPFFFALTISYILKDRFKELSRNYIFKRIMSGRYQFSYKVTDPIDNKLIVKFEDQYQFVSLKECSKSLRNEIHRLRKINRNRHEDILFYEKKHELKASNVDDLYDGIKDRIVFNIRKMLRNIPKEIQDVYLFGDDGYEKVTVDKSRVIYVILTNDDINFQTLELSVNYNGIISYRVISEPKTQI